jgi:hypothetical protein
MFHRNIVPEYGTGCFVACGRRQGLLALDLGSIFEKLLHQKTFKFYLQKLISVVADDVCRGCYDTQRGVL